MSDLIRYDSESLKEWDKETIRYLREENLQLMRRNRELQEEVYNFRRSPVAIALLILTRVVIVSSSLGILAAFIRPEQLDNVLFLGAWLGIGLWFVSDDDFLF